VFVVRDTRSNVSSFLDRLDLPRNRRKVADELKSLTYKWRDLFNKNIWRLQGSNYINLLTERWWKAANIYLSDSSLMKIIRLRVFCTTRLELSTSLMKTSADIKKFDIMGKTDMKYQLFQIEPGLFDASISGQIEVVCFPKSR
jgi:hypothetical protein